MKKLMYSLITQLHVNADQTGLPLDCIIFLGCRTKMLHLLSPGHMDRFTHVCKFCVYANFTHVSKSVHVTAIFPLLRIRKICIYAKFALGLEQVQISKFTFTYVSKICIHANLSM